MSDRYPSNKQYPDAYVLSQMFRGLVATTVSKASTQFGYVANHPFYFYYLVDNIDVLFDNFGDLIDVMTDASVLEGIDFSAESMMTEEESCLVKATAAAELSRKASEAKANNIHLKQAIYLALGTHYEDEYIRSVRSLGDLTEEDLDVLHKFGLRLLADTVRWAEVFDYVRVYTAAEKRSINQHLDALGGVIAQTDQDISEMTEGVSQMSETGKAQACIGFVTIIAAVYILSHLLDEALPGSTHISHLLTSEELNSEETDMVTLAWFTALTAYVSSFIGLIPQEIRNEFGILF